MTRLLELYKDREDARTVLAQMEARRDRKEAQDNEFSPAWRVEHGIADVKERIAEIEEEIAIERDRASRSGS